MDFIVSACGCYAGHLLYGKSDITKLPKTRGKETGAGILESVKKHI